MDKLTKAFVIVASSVVLAVGGVWLIQQYAAYQAKERCIQRETAARIGFHRRFGPYTETQMRHRIERDGICVD